MPNKREKLVELPIEDALLVLREEHRQRTDSYTTYLAHGEKGDPAEEVGLDALAIAISALEKTKWISVKDRLPEEEGWYLVYTTPNREHKSINKAMFCKGYVWGNFEPYWRGAGGHWANVAHWMPMPNPPKGE